jgi:hypothetical protein
MPAASPSGIPVTQYQFVVDPWAALSWHRSMACLLRIVVPGYPQHVAQRGVRSRDAGGRWSSAVSPADSGATVEKLIGRDLSRGRPGRPRKRPL